MEAEVLLQTNRCCKSRQLWLLTLSVNSERARGLRWLSGVQEGPGDEWLSLADSESLSN